MLKGQMSPKFHKFTRSGVASITEAVSLLGTPMATSVIRPNPIRFLKGDVRVGRITVYNKYNVISPVNTAIRVLYVTIA